MIDVTAIVDTKGLDQYIAELSANVIATVDREVQMTAEDARSRVDVGTGALQRTIDSEIVSRTPAGGEWAIFAGDMTGGADDGSPVDYAEWQEYNSGHPYMVPAAEAAFVRMKASLTAVAENPSGR